MSKQLSFSDFMKVFLAYQQYTDSMPSTPVTPQAPISQIPAAQVTAPTPVYPTVQPMAMPPIADTPQRDNPIDMTEYVKRLEALEQRAPMPTMDTPKPATVDDIILGIIGAPKQRGDANNG